MTKSCIKCSKILKGLQKKFCEECKILGSRDRANKYSAKNREKLRAYEKEYRKNNVDKERARSILYREQNKELVKEKRRDKARQSRHNNPIFRLKENISRTIRRALLSKNGTKNNTSILQYVSWSLDDLRMHLEQQFEPWMNWNNYGAYDKLTHDVNPTWQIDHIVPQSDLPYKCMDSANFRACWELTNLRPLDAKTNLLDGIYRVRHKRNS